MTHAAHSAATALAPLLRARLTAQHGADWLDVVNAARRTRHLPPGRSLDDDRFCLGLFARDKGTRGWADDAVRDAAAALKSLADAAAHGRSLPTDAVTVARQHAERLRQWAGSQQPGASGDVR